MQDLQTMTKPLLMVFRVLIFGFAENCARGETDYFRLFKTFILFYLFDILQVLCP